MSLPAPILEYRYGEWWVLFNSKWWAIQNYTRTKLANGTDIPQVTDATEWSNLVTPGWCWYNNTADTTFQAKYGRIYNAHAVIAGIEMPCEGCRVPNKSDWTSLETFLIDNGYNWDGTTEGNKIGKSLASNGGEWGANATAGNVGNDQASNNSTGLGLLPGGYRSNSGAFFNAGIEARYHATGNVLVDSGLLRQLLNSNQSLLESAYSQAFHLNFGSSIRIVRDYVPARRYRGSVHTGVSIF
jgi:uncharacterized protein (TIGR02145 family)